MRASSRSRVFVVIAAAVLLAMAGGLTGRAPASARRNPGSPPPQQQRGADLYGCDRTFGRPPEGHLVKRTNPAGGQSVHPGDSVVVVLTWDPRDWTSDRLHKVLDCVAVNGRLDPSLQDGESPTANDGRFSTAFTVPSDVPDGAQICDQAMLSGPSPRGDYDRQISNRVCHTVSSGGRAACGSSSCGGGCSQSSPCRRQPPCDRGCGRPPCDRCGDEAPCSGGCARPSPCDQRCAAPPSCDRDCRPACDQRDSCDAGPSRRDDDARHHKDCDCDGHHRGLISRLIRKLV